MWIFSRKEDIDFPSRAMKCKICGQEIHSKIKNKYQICRSCILNAKELCSKKQKRGWKQETITLTIIGILSLLALINILAAVKNDMIPALLLTGFTVIFGLVLLGLSLDD